jgi:pilus assembly protein Flp/PilA
LFHRSLEIQFCPFALPTRGNCKQRLTKTVSFDFPGTGCLGKDGSRSCEPLLVALSLKSPGKEKIVQKLSKQASIRVMGFLKNEDGPTAVEYAVMLALIIVVCIAAVTTLGGNANKTFTTAGKVAGS